MNTDRITVIGAGYVGLVTAVGLTTLGYAVDLVETRSDRLEPLRCGEVPIHEEGLQEAYSRGLQAGLIRVSDRPLAEDAGLLMVCVGTPIGADGRSDLGQLRSALTSLQPQIRAGATLIVRSTLPVGTTPRVVEWAGVPTTRLFTNPEFLRQGTALYDFLHPSRIVIGHFPDADQAALERVRETMSAIPAPVLVVDVTAAEIIKNGANAFLALKLSYANEMASLCEEFGTDVGPVLEAIGLDPRIGSQFMRPSYGFGGSCLPKELQTLAVAGRSRGLLMHITTAASAANHASQQRFADRISAELDGAEGRTIAFLGLAFKAGTDDVRDSPAVAVASHLLNAGAIVRAFDPAAASNAARELPGLTIMATPEEAVCGADATVIATEWPEFAGLDWAELRPSMAQSLVIDGRRMLDGATMRSLGYRYVALGAGIEREAAGVA